MKQYPPRIVFRLAMLVAMLGVVLGAQGGFGASPAQAAPWTAGGYTTLATAAPATVAPGNTVIVTASVTSTAAATALVDLEIYSAAGAKVFQRALDGQVFAAGELKLLLVDWNVPAGLAAGVYTVRIGIFSPNWGTLYHWNNSAGLVSVGGMSTPPPGGASPRVMPLGDSLTDGYNIPGGYRVELWNLLATDHLPVDFVGSLSNGPASLPDHDHEGHSGWRIDEIAGGVVEWLTVARPDVVLLMIGTNDMGQDFNVATAPDRLSALIDQITTTLPAANVVVASIPRMGYGSSPLLDQVQVYNATIPGIVAAKVGQGKHVSYVDLFAVIQESDLYDGVHMVASGNQKMAQVWHAGLTPLISPGPVATPTRTPTPLAATATRTATPIPATATRTSTSVPATATRTATPLAATATRTPTPMAATATRTATRSPTPVAATATSTRTATATVAGGAGQTVTFDDRAGQDQVLNGQYPAGLIDWGSGRWYHSGPWGAFTTKSVSFVVGGQTSAVFTFVAPRRLVSLRAYNGSGGSATVTVACAGQTTTTTTIGAGQAVIITTGWSGTCSAVTVTSTVGWDVNFDDVVVG